MLAYLYAYILTYLHTYIALRCITLHYIALHCITLRYIALHCMTLHYTALHCITLHTTHQQHHHHQRDWPQGGNHQTHDWAPVTNIPSIPLGARTIRTKTEHPCPWGGRGLADTGLHVDIITHTHTYIYIYVCIYIHCICIHTPIFICMYM